MAVLGGQMLITLAALSIFHKFGLRFSFARWLVSNRLIKYFLPSNKELIQQAGLGPVKGSKNKKHDKHLDQQTNFSVPKNLDFPLYASKVKDVDLMNLNYYTEFQWLIDFSLAALIVYFMSETYFYYFPTQEINLGLIWCCLVVAFSLKILFTLTANFFRGGDEALGERDLCITFGAIFFIFSMVILIVNDNFLEFGLRSAYANFNHTASLFLKAHQIEHASVGPTSEIMFKFWLSIISGILGIFFIFPGLRFAQMHKDALLNNQNSNFRVWCLHISFVSPIFLLLLWVRPISRTIMVDRNWGSRKTLISSDSFEITRIILILCFIIYRILLMNTYLQSYLNLALEKVSNLKKESGKIKNLDLQKMVARIYYYLCVVILQYVSPLLLTLYFALLLKTLGQHSWLSYFRNTEENLQSTNEVPSAEFTWKTLRIIFNPLLFRAILSYLTWWSVFASFLSSLIGYFFHTNFKN